MFSFLNHMVHPIVFLIFQNITQVNSLILIILNMESPSWLLIYISTKNALEPLNWMKSSLRKIKFSVCVIILKFRNGFDQICYVFFGKKFISFQCWILLYNHPTAWESSLINWCIYFIKHNELNLHIIHLSSLEHSVVCKTNPQYSPNHLNYI